MEDLDQEQRIALDQLGEEYYRRHGVAVEFLKAEVGAGDEYANSVARAVISSNGAWFECIDLPMEFSGMAGGPVDHRFVTDSEALKLVSRLHQLCTEAASDHTRELSLFVLYSRAGIADERDAYVFHLRAPKSGEKRAPLTLGRFRAETLPLFFRCRLDLREDGEGIPFRHGVLFCLTDIGERNLLVHIPYEGNDIRDLADIPENPAAQ